MKILVTGAAGFIGMHVAQKLLQRGDEVVHRLGKTNHIVYDLKYIFQTSQSYLRL